MQTEINTEWQNIAQCCLYVGSKIVRLLEEESRIVGGENREMLVKAWASQVVLIIKNPSANAGDKRDSGLIPGSGRSPGEGNGYPLQYSCLENPMDREAWQTTVHRVSNDQTQLKQLSMHTCWSRDIKFVIRWIRSRELMCNNVTIIIIQYCILEIHE